MIKRAFLLAVFVLVASLAFAGPSPALAEGACPCDGCVLASGSTSVPYTYMRREDPEAVAEVAERVATRLAKQRMAERVANPGALCAGACTPRRVTEHPIQPMGFSASNGKGVVRMRWKVTGFCRR